MPNPYPTKPLSRPAPTTIDSLNLLQWCSPIRDQGQEGECSGEATMKLVEFAELKLGTKPFIPYSAQFNYGMSRKLTNSWNTDSGSWVNIALSIPVQYGACPESMDSDAQSNMYNAITQAQLDEAAKFKASSYQMLSWGNGVTPSQAIKQAMSQYQVPVSVALGVTSSLFYPANGVVDGGNPTNEGHNVAFFGFEPDPQRPGKTRFILVNSWGTGYGIVIPPMQTAGCVYITEDYVDQYCWQAGMLFYDAPKPKSTCALSATFGSKSVPTGQPNTLTVITMNNGQPIGNQQFEVSTSGPQAPYPMQFIDETEANGFKTLQMAFTAKGTYKVTVTWKAPDGGTQTATVSADWT